MIDAAFLADWLNLLLRWAHLITGIAWIGASFYFVWLDNHLQPPLDPADAAKGIGGELWAVHGGGFYIAQKYTVGARRRCRPSCTGSSGRPTRPGHRLLAALPGLLLRRRGRADRSRGDAARRKWRGDRHRRSASWSAAGWSTTGSAARRSARTTLTAGRPVRRSTASSPPGRSATCSPAAAPSCISAPCSARSWC